MLMHAVGVYSIAYRSRRHVCASLLRHASGALQYLIDRNRRNESKRYHTNFDLSLVPVLYCINTETSSSAQSSFIYR